MFERADIKIGHLIRRKQCKAAPTCYAASDVQGQVLMDGYAGLITNP